ncbi:MAG: CehA/McbA family metallohydrolase [Planctomycetes bacterium]|nr:CehA/McbA family metallohydrolase [Planctomycetota bacterium]
MLHVPLLALLAPSIVSGLQAPAQLVAAETPSAVLRFSIVDAQGGKALPGRLTFVPAKRPESGVAELFPRTDAAPNELAVRKDVVYALRGTAAITVPAGTFTVHASRGLEWSLATQTFTFEAGKTYDWTAKLAHEVDTTGWISADFHLHTYTYSGHGDANLEERVITLAGEGVEFAVATDHNHHTDYGPTLQKLGATGAFTTITGNEVSTPIGHFNAFPLDPARPPVDSKLTDGGALFKLVRAEPNAFGIVPIIQLNHPRLRDIDWFFHTGLDPVTGTSSQANWSPDFDTLEVFNANAAQGYSDSEKGPRDSTYIGSVLQDWFHLLNRGGRYGAVGNSDSHEVHFDFAGWPRNFVRSSTDDPARIDPREVANALRAKQMFTTMGPFVTFRFDDGRPVGPVAPDTQPGQPKLFLQVQAASWIDVDRILVIVNGDQVATLDVPPERKPMRYDGSVDLNLTDDAWVTVIVEGDDSLAPVLADTSVKHLPWAVANPIWIDANRDGVWSSPWERTKAMAAGFKTDVGANTRYGFLPGSARALLIQAGAESKQRWTGRLVRRAFTETHRDAILSAARAAEALADLALVDALETAFRAQKDDGYARLCLFRALKACGAKDVERLYADLVVGLRPDRRVAHQKELGQLFPGTWIDAWSVVGPFPSPSKASKLDDEQGPEQDATLAKTFDGRDGAKLAWTAMAPIADGQGFVDLVGTKKKDAEESIFVARTWLHSAEARQVGFALGTDDASRLRVNGALVVQDDGAHNAALRHFGTIDLKAGWNAVVLEVQNGGGASGFRIGLLAPGVTCSATPK